jgi:hypothetical protein
MSLLNKILIVLLIVAFGILSLYIGKSKIEIPKEDDTSYINVKAEKAYSRFKKMVTHKFSSNRLDTFLLSVDQTYNLDAEVKFKIISSESKNIYERTFPLEAFYGFGPDEVYPTEKQIEEHILNNLNSFFEPDNFISPAIDPKEIYIKDYNYMISQEKWEEIKEQKKSVGFYYNIWEEGQIWIAYDFKENKVIQYQTCC